jgi:peroxiredoxin family protein
MMKSWMKSANVASIQKLLEACQSGGVRMIGCQMTVDLFDLKREDLIDGIDYGGASTFFAFAGEADVSLFI